MKFTCGLLTAVFVLTGFASAQVFTVTDIGPNVWPTGINNREQVSAYGNCCGLFEQQPFLWSRKSGFTDLVALDDTAGAAMGINESGDAVGWSLDGAADPDAILWPHHGGLVEVDLGDPPLDAESVANAINDAGEVAGTGVSNSPVFLTSIAFFWSAKTGRVDIATGASANAISSDGTVVGSLENSSSFIWTKNTGIKILPLPSSNATGISKGFVVGTGACLPPHPCGAYHAFVWSRWGTFDLGTLPGDTSSSATAINSRLEIVGVSLDSSSNSTAFFWEVWHHHMIDLNKLVHAPGWRLVGATAINDRGQIVGHGTLNGVEHGFLLTRNRRKDKD